MGVTGDGYAFRPRGCPVKGQELAVLDVLERGEHARAHVAARRMLYRGAPASFCARKEGRRWIHRAAWASTRAL